MDVVSWTFGNANCDPNQPIFIDASDASRHISTAQARSLVRRLIAGFRSVGLRKGDTVCILTLSNIYYPIFFLAIVGAGGRVAGGNPGHTVYELEHLLSKCNARFMITEPSLLDKARTASGKCGIHPNHIFLHEDDAATTRNLQSWRKLLDHGEADWEVLSEAESAKTISAYYSTSGTTGAPKFAAISHAYQIASGRYIEKETRAKPYKVSRLVSLPLLHAFAAPLVHTAALRSGTPTFIMSRFNASGFISMVSQHLITEFPVVPSMLISLITSPQCTAAALGSVREVICAGAPLSLALAEKFSAALTAPSARLVQLYGATEAGWISSVPYQPPNNFPLSAVSTGPCEKPRVFSLQSGSPTPTVGIPLPGYQLRLVHGVSGLVITDTNVPGMLQVKTPHAFLHYVGAEQASRDSFTADGWLITGDIASRDEQGQYYIVDRAKDMIKVRGWQVAPAEIEAALACHPGIADCAVLGIEDTKGASGEIPIAFIAVKDNISTAPTTSRDGSVLSEDVLKSWLRVRLAGYKVPQLIRFVPAVPRNPAGKVLRRLLREQYVPAISAGIESEAATSVLGTSHVVNEKSPHSVAGPGFAPPDTSLSTAQVKKQLDEVTRAESSTGVVSARATTLDDSQWPRSDGVLTCKPSPSCSSRPYDVEGSTNGPGGCLAATYRSLVAVKSHWLLLVPAGLGLGAFALGGGVDLLTEIGKWTSGGRR